MPNDVLDVVQRFIRATGRIDLVQDYHNGDLSDKGVFTFINDGIKDLDRRLCVEVDRVSKYAGEVVTNTSCAVIPDYKQLSTVYYKGVNGTIYNELKWLSMNEAMRKYSLPIDEVEVGDPLYYVVYTDERPSVIENFADLLNTFTWNGSVLVTTGALVTLWAEFCSSIINFTAIDTDSDGFISEADLTTYGITTGFGMGVLFTSIDLDTDGVVTRDDLILYLTNNSPVLTLERGWLEGAGYVAPAREYGASAILSNETYLHSIVDRVYDMGIYAGIRSVYGADILCKVTIEVDNPNEVLGILVIQTYKSSIVLGTEIIYDNSMLYTQYGMIVSPNSTNTFSFILSNKEAAVLAVMNNGSGTVYINSLTVAPITDSLPAEDSVIHLLPQVTDGYVVVTGFPATETVTTLTDTNYWTHSKRIAILSLAAQYHHELTQAQTSRAEQLNQTINKLIRDLINDDLYNNGPVEDVHVIRG